MPEIQDNKYGWGPIRLPEKYRDVPYQPFNKSDPLGKAADWVTQFQKTGRREQSAVSIQVREDASFTLVDTKTKKPTTKKTGWTKPQQQQHHHQYQQQNRSGFQQLTNRKIGKKEQLQQNRRWTQQNFMQRYEQSLKIRSDWEVVETFSLPSLAKLKATVPSSKVLRSCGNVKFYEKSFDRINPRTAKPLKETENNFFKVTTTDDPVLEELISASEGKVFATDVILVALMTAPRSLAPWDIIIHRAGDVVVLDKRDNGTFDYLTVDETGSTVNVNEESEKLACNAPAKLSVEATVVNQNFSQHVLGKEEVSFENPNPFVEDEEEQATAAPIGFFYRSWDLDDIRVVARTEVDAAIKDKDGKTSFVTLRALNEWEPRMEWRQKLISQAGAVLATGLRNNGCKMARWALQAVLADSAQLKLGYVSRDTPKDPHHHTILQTQFFKPLDLCRQMNLHPTNAWGILQFFFAKFLALPKGTYCLVRGTQRDSLKLYSVPPGTFDSEDEEEEEATKEMGAQSTLSFN
eukprot:GCRY01001395.1.p1 GENE.GCRY01001395.1~~GCRY01001395.1.p1  ORF type:complete len:566 (+),score=142.54 GCRY01001395.1:141-1700(+)